ncbi:hypothetical protein [Streptomyces sp. NPDC059575]|uniref:hypothetical protein n=1 Tax=Streptomyces sp. NPDC059575 TaxID=3346872 RepID=UPI00367B49F5
MVIQDRVEYRSRSRLCRDKQVGTQGSHSVCQHRSQYLVLSELDGSQRRVDIVGDRVDLTEEQNAARFHVGGGEKLLHDACPRGPSQRGPVLLVYPEDLLELLSQLQSPQVLRDEAQSPLD